MMKFFNRLQFLQDLHGAGVYTASIVIIPMPRRQAQAMLPGQLELAHQEVASAGRHPVLFMFGAQRDVSPQPLKLFDWTYLEFAVGIPYAQWVKPQTDPPGPFLFMPRLYLNRTRPIIAGLFYGLAKARASIGATGTSYIVNDLKDNRPIISAHFKTRSEPGPAVDFPLFEAAIPRFLQQTFVGQTRLGLFTSCRFDWNLSQAKIQAIETQIEIAQPFLPALTVGRYHRPGLDTDTLGAFRIVTHWALSRPRLVLA